MLPLNISSLNLWITAVGTCSWTESDWQPDFSTVQWRRRSCHHEAPPWWRKSSGKCMELKQKNDICHIQPMAAAPTKNIFQLKSVGLSADRSATGHLTKVWSSLGGARVTLEGGGGGGRAQCSSVATLPGAPSHPYTEVCHCTHECKHTRDVCQTNCKWAWMAPREVNWK